MRATVLGVLLASAMGTAAAGDDVYGTRYTGNEYSAKLLYTLNFGGTQRHSQNLGLRLDNEVAALHGAPALVKVQYIPGMVTPRVALQGIELVHPVSSNATEGGAVASWTAGEWAAIAIATVTVVGIGAKAVHDEGEDNTPPVSGTGSGGGP